MVRKKNQGRGPGNDEPVSKAPDAKSTLVKDASEVRALMDRAQRLLRGEPEPQDALSVAGEAIDADDVDAIEETPLPDPNVLVSPKPVRRSDDEEASDDGAREDDEVALDALPDAFITSTMGTMLLSQGRAADAQAIFERVLAKNPTDAEALRGLEKADAALRAETRGVLSLASSSTLVRKRITPTLTVSEGEAKEPDGLLERATPPWGYDVDELRALPVDPTTIVVFWELRAATIERAVLEQPSRNTLMIRVVSLVRGSDGELRRVERLEGPIARVGDWFVWGVANGATHEVSVGVAGHSGFTAILTAEPIATPRGAPAKARSVVRARIVLPERSTVVAASVSKIAEVVGPSAVLGALREARATPALEDAQFVAERRAWLEEIPGASAEVPASSEERTVEHWSEADPSRASEGDATDGSGASDEPEFDTIHWTFAPGSSWELSLSIARRLAGLPSSPSSPGAHWGR
ncbi:MAG: DUF4912 domain-containing protein [Myxococcales bacterium]|nr:DUF4912 domain-containing protein [Myxococcales bacterium]